ncbi:hypothetical protein FA10DRAFT_300241 [Acaromyces ingoldii]|uniref:GDP/GTP exchange factor Sec2 N-terminal domain-containing protein n=1 Tax=Acaromyces ingoldii TaxID=215250 RepID=A0A316YSK4_9BASI|nr:hypothetical protein FA10DRAFT_300241 [Acaromyces ingoldii]PWN91648.1 hypothetical protein FA10DRAFT_300241 [Acaromyces ingoldii]
MASSIVAPPRRSSQATPQNNHNGLVNHDRPLGLGLGLALNAEDDVVKVPRKLQLVATPEADEPTPRNTNVSFADNQQQQQQQQQLSPTSVHSFHSRPSEEARPQMHSRQPSSATSEVDMGVQLDLALSYISRGPLAGTALSQASSSRPASSAYFSSSRPRQKIQQFSSQKNNPHTPGSLRHGPSRLGPKNSKGVSSSGQDEATASGIRSATVDDFRTALERLNEMKVYIRSHSSQSRVAEGEPDASTSASALPPVPLPPLMQSPASSALSPGGMDGRTSPPLSWTGMAKRPASNAPLARSEDIAHLLTQARALAQPTALFANAKQEEPQRRTLAPQRPPRKLRSRMELRSPHAEGVGQEQQKEEDRAEGSMGRRSRSGLMTSASTPEGALGRVPLDSGSSTSGSIEGNEEDRDQKEKGEEMEEVLTHEGAPRQQQQRGVRRRGSNVAQPGPEGKGLTIEVSKSQSSDAATEVDALRAGLRFVIGCYDDLHQQQQKPGYGGVSEAIIAHLTKERMQNFFPRDSSSPAPDSSGAATDGASNEVGTLATNAKNTGALRPRSRSFLKALAKGKPSLVSDAARFRLSSHSTGLNRISRLPTIDARRLEATSGFAGDGGYSHGVVGPSNRLSMMTSLTPVESPSKDDGTSSDVTSSSHNPGRANIGSRRRTNSNPLSSSLWSARIGGGKLSSPSARSESNLGGFFESESPEASNGSRSSHAEALRKAYNDVARIAEEKRTMQAEMEELSQAVFAEANEMVRSERIKAAALDKELESLRKAMAAAQQQRNEEGEELSEIERGAKDENEAQMMAAVAQAARETAEAEDEAAAWKLEAESFEERCQILEEALAKAMELLAERNDAMHAAEDDSMSRSVADADGEYLEQDEAEKEGKIVDNETTWAPGAWPMSLTSSSSFEAPAESVVTKDKSHSVDMLRAPQTTHGPGRRISNTHDEISSLSLAASPSLSPHSGISGSIRRSSVLPHHEFNESTGSFYSLGEAEISDEASISQRQASTVANPPEAGGPGSESDDGSRKIAGFPSLLALSSSKREGKSLVGDEDNPEPEETLRLSERPKDAEDHQEDDVDDDTKKAGFYESSLSGFNTPATTPEDVTIRRSSSVDTRTYGARQAKQTPSAHQAQLVSSHENVSRSRSRSRSRSKQRWSGNYSPIVSSRTSVHMDDELEDEDEDEQEAQSIADLKDEGISIGNDGDEVRQRRRKVIDPFDASSQSQEASPLPHIITKRLGPVDNLLAGSVASGGTGDVDSPMPSPVSSGVGGHSRRSSALPGNNSSRHASLALPPRPPQPQSPLPLPPANSPSPSNSQSHADIDDRSFLFHKPAALSVEPTAADRSLQHASVNDFPQGRLTDQAPTQRQEQGQEDQERREEEQEMEDSVTTIPNMSSLPKTSPRSTMNPMLRPFRKASGPGLPVVSYAGDLFLSEVDQDLDTGPFSPSDENGGGASEMRESMEQIREENYYPVSVNGRQIDLHDRRSHHDRQSRVTSGSGSIHSTGGHTTAASISGSSIFDGSLASSVGGGQTQAAAKGRKGSLNPFSNLRRSKASSHTVDSNETSLTTPSWSSSHAEAPRRSQESKDVNQNARSPIQRNESSFANASDLTSRASTDEGARSRLESSNGSNAALSLSSSGAAPALAQRKTSTKKKGSSGKSSILKNMPSTTASSDPPSMLLQQQSTSPFDLKSRSIPSVASRTSIADDAGDVHRRAPSIASTSSAGAITAFSGSTGGSSRLRSPVQSPIEVGNGDEEAEAEVDGQQGETDGWQTFSQISSPQIGSTGRPPTHHYFGPSSTGKPPVPQQETFGRKRNYGARRR